MANTQAIASSFKLEVLTGTHVLGTDTLKGALYLATATINGSTTAYTATGEVSGTNYTAGGATITTANPPALDGTTAHFTPSASLTWSTVTLATAFDCLLIYNSTKTNKAIGAFTFGSTTVTAGNFTLNFPTDDGTTGLIRLA